MLTTRTIYQPHYGPQGQPFTVHITTGSGETISLPCWAEAEAWDIRDAALDEGYSARILGLPLRLSCHIEDAPQLPDIAD